MSEKSKNLILIFDKCEIKYDLSSNLVRQYMNRIVIDEEAQFEVLDLFKFKSKIFPKKMRYYNSDYIERMIESKIEKHDNISAEILKDKEKELIHENPEIHLIVGFPDMNFYDGRYTGDYATVQRLAAKRFHNISSYTVISAKRTEYMTHESVKNDIGESNEPQDCDHCDSSSDFEDYLFGWPSEFPTVCVLSEIEEEKDIESSRMLQELDDLNDAADHLDSFFSLLSHYHFDDCPIDCEKQFEFYKMLGESENERVRRKIEKHKLDEALENVKIKKHLEKYLPKLSYSYPIPPTDTETQSELNMYGLRDQWTSDKSYVGTKSLSNLFVKCMGSRYTITGFAKSSDTRTDNVSMFQEDLL